jgi:hypothetical protein
LRQIESIEARLWLLTKAVSLLINQVKDVETLLEKRQAVDQPAA